MKRIIITFLLLLMCPFLSVAEEKPIALMADKESYHVGDVIRLKIEMSGKGFTLGEVNEKRLEPFEITAQKEIYNESTGSTRFIIEGRIFKTGEFSIPPFIIIDSAGKEFTSDPGLIAVKSLLEKEDEALREMKPQATVTERGPFWPWIVVALILLLFVALIYTFIRRRKKEELREELPPKPPHEVALEEIARIEGLNLLREGKIKEHYALISDAIRTYVGSLFSLDAMEMTTGELMTSLNGSGYADMKSLNSFLKGCDMVKFAKFRPSDMDIEGLADKARGFVHVVDEKPVEEEESAPAAA